MMNKTATAYQEWDRQWQTKTGRANWVDPAIDVAKFAKDLKETANSGTVLKALDLGCGVGRHAIYLAELGFDTYALDGSAAGIEYAKNAASDRNLSIQFTQGIMENLPYDSGFFDYVLAFNVIYHGDAKVVRQCLQEIHRVLKVNSFFQGTMLSKRNGNYGKGAEIAPNTFVITDRKEKGDDKNHPHFYCNAAELCGLLTGFELLSLVDQVHQKQESWHWHLVAERLGSALV